MKLWLDDVRPAPNGWLWARTAREAIEALDAAGPRIVAVSLDHDLGAPASAGLLARGRSEETGLLVAAWIADSCTLRRGTPIRVHSWNVAGAQRMARVMRGAGFFRVEVRPFDLSEA